MRWEVVLGMLLVAGCSAEDGGRRAPDGLGGGSGITDLGAGAPAGGVPGNPDGTAGNGTADEGVPPTCLAQCADFPTEPWIDMGSQPAITQAEIDGFGAADDFESGALCVMEPHLSEGSTPGALMPVNWLRPRFRWVGAASDTLYEVRLQSSAQANDLVAYTRDSQWTLPAEVWKDAAPNLEEVTVTVRALDGSGRKVGTRGSFHVAPVEAGGSMVFWATNSSLVTINSSRLHGFSVGDEGVIEVLSPGRVETGPILHENGRDLRGEYSPKAGFEAGEVQCIGCHSGTPDGLAVVFTDDYPWPKVITSVEEGISGTTPPYISAGAEVLLKQPWLGTQTMSKSHWSTGDRVLISSYGDRTEPFVTQSGQQDRLVWFDLETDAEIIDEVPAVSSPMPPTRDEAKNMRNMAITASRGVAWDTLAMDGETRNAVTPSWSHDGTRVAYVSTDLSPNGHPAYAAQLADVHVVPYNNKAGGAVTPLAGASSADWLEYYPEFSPDDAFVAITRAPNRGVDPDGPYYNRNGEIHIVSGDGSGERIRLAANDPVSCSGESSPGVINSWPKWSPRVRSDGEGKSYYFLIFSSARDYPDLFEIPRSQYTPQTLDTRSSQLYMAAIVVDENGEVTTYPAVYLWNQNRLVQEGVSQDVANSNLTPAWAEFEIPPVEII